jgi:pimeloyl-ACP methyl ester carboxylesterase
MSLWRTIRRIWIITGSTFFVVFTLWALIAYQAWGVEGAMASDRQVEVIDSDEAIHFRPQAPRSASGLLFFPGALVDPQAYAPLARAVAASGAPAVIVKVPARGGFSIASPGEVVGRALGLIEVSGEQPWVVAGHSKGAFFAVLFTQEHPDRTKELVLLGSTHPRDFDFSSTTVPVTKLYGTRDGIAPERRVHEAARNLPASTRWVRIEGGNHSQFGSYGFQPMDHWATISRAEQQRVVVREVVRAIQNPGSAHATPARAPSGTNL